MIDINLVIICEECNKLASISELYIDDKTSEEEYLVKEYTCSKCKSKIIEKEYINYIVDKKFKVRD